MLDPKLLPVQMTKHQTNDNVQIPASRSCAAFAWSAFACVAVARERRGSHGDAKNVRIRRSELKLAAKVSFTVERQRRRGKKQQVSSRLYRHGRSDTGKLLPPSSHRRNTLARFHAIVDFAPPSPQWRGKKSDSVAADGVKPDERCTSGDVEIQLRWVRNRKPRLDSSSTAGLAVCVDLASKLRAFEDEASKLKH